MHEHRFNREFERLRDPERIARLEVEWVVKATLEGLSEYKTLLDIGTGTGIFAEAFAARAIKVTGVDANPEMIPAAQGFVPSGTFQEAIAEKLPFAEGDFDLVFMGLVLHETDDCLAALKEARRVTNKRVAVLEWPAGEQAFGPPPGDRLSSELISSLAHEAGFTKIKRIALQNLILYLLDC